MRRGLLLCGVVASLAPFSAWAQGPADPPGDVETIEQVIDDGVVEEVNAPTIETYPPAFFAGYRPNTAMDMLGRIPGFSFDGGSGARGFAGTAGNVLIDGERPPSRGDSLSSVLSRVPASSVARIDIIRGGAGGVDMQGKPLVANVVRVQGGGLTGAVSASVNLDEDGGLTPNGQIQLQRRADGRSVEGSFRALKAGGPNSGSRARIDPTGLVLQDSRLAGRAEIFLYEATGVYEASLLGGRLRANTLLSYEDQAFNDRRTLIVPGGTEHSVNGGPRKEGEIGVRYSRDLPRGMSLEAVAFQSLFESDSTSRFETPTFVTDSLGERRSGESILSASVRFPRFGDWSLEAGGEGVLNWLETSSARRFNNAPFSVAGDSIRVEEFRSDTFVTATWTPAPGLSIAPGLRYERSTITAGGSAGASDKSLQFLKPRLNLAWAPSPAHQFGLRVERIAEQLSFDSFASTASFSNSAAGVFGVGNPDLEPEKSWLAEVRYEFKFAGQGSILIQYARRRIEDVLGRTVVHVPAAGRYFDITRNFATATREQLTFNTTLPLDRLGLAGGLLTTRLAWRQSEVTDPVTGDRHRLNNDEPRTWSIGLSQNIVAWKLTWNLFLDGDDKSTSWSPRQVSRRYSERRVGVSVSYRPSPQWSLGAGVNNITGGDTHGALVFHTDPRFVPVPPAYFERSVSNGRTQAFVSLRRSF